MSVYHKSLTQLKIDACKIETLIDWVRQNIKPGSKLRFTGSRSNRIKSQYREVIEWRECSYNVYGYDSHEFGAMYIHVGSIMIVSKNVNPNSLSHSVVVAENNAVFLKEIEIDGVWTSIKNLKLNANSEPKGQIDIRGM